MDYQALPPTDLAILAPPDAFVSGLLAALGDAATKPRPSWLRKPPPDPVLPERLAEAARNNAVARPAPAR